MTPQPVIPRVPPCPSWTLAAAGALLLMLAGAMPAAGAPAATDEIAVVRPATPDPFSMPVQTIRSLLPFRAQTHSGQRVRVQGTVTLLRQSRHLFIQDASGGLYLEPREMPALQPGDRVDAIGVPAAGEYTPVLQNAIVRRIRSGASPEPAPVTALQAIGSNLTNEIHDAELVRIKARFLGHASSKDDQVLVLQEDQWIFNAHLDPAQGKLPGFEKGSALELTGVCSVQVDEDRNPRAFRLLLRSPADVVVLEASPWWTVQRTLAALGVAFLISAMAIGWVTVLRKQVRDQTARIRRQWEQETALEKRYRELFENASDIVYTHDLAGNLISVNPSAEKVFGYSQEEARRMNIAQLMGPEQLKLAQTMTARNVAGERVTTYELELQAKDGRRVILEISSRAVYQDGQPAAIQGIARDITERKHAELRKTAFSTLGQSLSLATKAEEAAKIVVDIADQLLGWDACYLHFLTPEPRRRVPVLNFDIIDGQRTSIPTAHEGKEASAIDMKVIAEGAQLILRDDPAAPDPSLVRFGDKNRPSASLLFVPIRHGAHVVGVLSIQSYTPKAYDRESLNLLQSLADLCAGALERIQAGTALRQSEERFSKAFRASPVAIGISTLAEGRMLDANEAFLDLFRYRREEVVGRTALELGIWVHEGDRDQLIHDLREQRSVRNRLYQFRAKNGEIRQGLVSVEVVELGREPCLIFITHDITERLNLEERVRQAQKMEAVGQLAAGVAHDFNNIMTIIQGHTGLLLASGGMDPKKAESLREIAQAADRAARLTRQLLTFSRRQVMQRQVLDLNELVSNVTTMLRRLLGEDVGLHFNYSPSVPPVLADVSMIEQVIVNLAVNARDAMPKGGQLILSTLARQIDENYLRHEPQARVGQYACLLVKDTGSGMDAATQSKLFEPFFTTKDVGKGTGLGLATVYGIVKQHQGWIEVVSAPGKGSTFKIFLPAHSPRPAPRKEESQAKRERLTGDETILLVEDEPALRSLARRVLLHYGYRVLEAGSGVEALKIWQQHSDSIHLLLTDMVMPEGMSGRELAEQLQRERKDLKMIFTSGYSLDVVGQDFALRDGINFLQKPYFPATLAQAVRDCLDG